MSVKPEMPDAKSTPLSLANPSLPSGLATAPPLMMPMQQTTGHIATTQAMSSNTSNMTADAVSGKASTGPPHLSTTQASNEPAGIWTWTPAASLKSDEEISTSDLTIDHLSQFIKITFGETEIFAPASMLCFHSDFFKAACKPHWESGRKKTVDMSAHSVESFSIFLTWMYTGNLNNSASLPKFKETGSLKDQIKKSGRNWPHLARCFILAEFLQASEFQNALCDEIVRLNEFCSLKYNVVIGCSPAAIGYVWPNTVAGSPLRRIMLENVFYLNMVPLGGGYNAEFLKELAQLGIQNHHYQRHEPAGTSRKAWKKDPCIYHTHPGAKAGYSCTLRN